MENVTIEHGILTTVRCGELGKETIAVTIRHYTWNSDDLNDIVSHRESEKLKEVADKIAELLKTIEL